MIAFFRHCVSPNVTSPWPLQGYTTKHCNEILSVDLLYVSSENTILIKLQEVHIMLLLLSLQNVQSVAITQVFLYDKCRKVVSVFSETRKLENVNSTQNYFSSSNIYIIPFLELNSIVMSFRHSASCHTVIFTLPVGKPLAPLSRYTCIHSTSFPKCDLILSFSAFEHNNDNCISQI